MQSQVPLWQVLVITALSGLVSGILVALVQNWNERRERLRDLRTTAASDLVTAVLIGMTPISAILRADSIDWNSLRPLCNQLNEAHDASIESTARVAEETVVFM